MKDLPHRTSQINQKIPRKFKDIASQPTPQEPERYQLRKICGIGFCLMNLIPLTSMKAHRVLEKIVSTELLSAWLKGTERLSNKTRLSVSQHTFGRKVHDKTTQLQTHTFIKKKRKTMAQMVETRSQKQS